jgi:hypothetical protein
VQGEPTFKPEVPGIDGFGFIVDNEMKVHTCLIGRVPKELRAPVSLKWESEADFLQAFGGISKPLDCDALNLDGERAFVAVEQQRDCLKRLRFRRILLPTRIAKPKRLALLVKVAPL